MSYFPHWKKVSGQTTDRLVAPNEYLPLQQMIPMGLQHVIAMFGSTVLAPLLMGFDANTAILMSGIGTLIFFVATGGRVPSYLGSSFAFIGGVVAVTGYNSGGIFGAPNMNVSVALGAIIVCGAVYALIGLIVMASNRHGAASRLIERLMPPVVTGAIVAVIGLNLAGYAVSTALGKSSPVPLFNVAMSLMTILCVGAIAVFTRGMARRLLILIGLLVSVFIYYIVANVLHWGPTEAMITFDAVKNAPWFGLPGMHTPVFEWSAISVITPIALILVAENLGHIRAVSEMTGENLDKYLGRAFLGDGIATIVSAFVGGTGVTTYSENIGVMAVTRIFSTLMFVIAALFAILLGFSPKFGAVIHSIPQPVLGGVAIIVFGLIAISGARIWVTNQVDFSENRNLIVAAVAIILGTGNYSFTLGSFTLDGIGTATFGSIILYQLLNLGHLNDEPQPTILEDLEELKKFERHE